MCTPCVCACVYACTCVRTYVQHVLFVCVCRECIHIRWVGMRWVYLLCVRTTPDVPKQLSTMAMRLALASLCTALSEGEGQSVTRGDWSGRGGVGRGWRKGLRCLTCEVEGRTHEHRTNRHDKALATQDEWTSIPAYPGTHYGQPLPHTVFNTAKGRWLCG